MGRQALALGDVSNADREGGRAHARAAGNHALVDGNKRLALLATVVFLRITGHVLDLTDDGAFAVTMSVAAGQPAADGIGKQLRLAQAPPPGQRERRPAELPGERFLAKAGVSAGQV